MLGVSRMANISLGGLLRAVVGNDFNRHNVVHCHFLSRTKIRITNCQVSYFAPQRFVQ